MNIIFPSFLNHLNRDVGRMTIIQEEYRPGTWDGHNKEIKPAQEDFMVDPAFW